MNRFQSIFSKLKNNYPEAAPSEATSKVLRVPGGEQVTEGLKALQESDKKKKKPSVRPFMQTAPTGEKPVMK